MKKILFFLILTLLVVSCSQSTDYQSNQPTEAPVGGGCGVSAPMNDFGEITNSEIQEEL